MHLTSPTHQLPLRLRVLAPAEVAKRPRCVPEHAQPVVLVEQRDEGLHSTGAEDKVTALGAVTGDVTECPDGLLADIVNRGRQKLNEDGDSAFVDDDLSVVRGTGSNVRERPCGLELFEKVVRDLNEVE